MDSAPDPGSGPTDEVGPHMLSGPGADAQAALFRTLLERMVDGVFVAQDYRFVFSNPALPRMLGYSREEFVGQPFSTVVAPDLLELWIERFRQRIGDGDEPPHCYEVRLRTRAGTREIPVELNATRIEFGGRRAVLGIVRDVSARKAAERALRDSEQRFRGAFEQAAVGIALVDPDGRFLRVNTTLCDIVGYSADELRGRTLTEVTHPDDVPAVAEQIRNMLAGGLSSCSIEKRHVHRDGSASWARMTLSLLRDSANAPSHFIAVIEDIHDRYLAQTALADSELRHRLLMQNLHAGVLACARDLTIGYGNPEACRLLRIPAGRMAGRTMGMLECRFTDAAGTLLSPDEDLVQRVFASGRALNDMMVGVRHDTGEDTQWMLVHAYPEFDTRQQVRQVMVMFIDITDRFRLEAERNADRQLKTAALNAITAHVAVLDKHGNILETNSSWRAFAGREGYVGNLAFTGVNYLQALARCSGPGSEQARSACEGIMSVMVGRSALFQMDYACHTDSERLWFSLKVTPMDARRDRVLVSHENITRIKLAEEAVRILANTDALTGLANRRHFFEVAEEEVVRAGRYDTPLTVLMADLDHFKRFNDEYGHAGGDAVLRSFAIVLSSLLRESDRAGRIGGEEFAVLLPHTSLDGALAFAERLMECVAENPPELRGCPASYTLSIGIAELGGDCNDLTALLRTADEALYRAKNAGRNRVEQAESSYGDEGQSGLE